MEYINEIIIAVDEAGLRSAAYVTLNNIAMYVMFVIALVNGLKLKTGFIATVVTIVVEHLLSGPIVALTLFVENGFQKTNQANGALIFAYIPLIAYLVAKALKKDYRQIWDVMMIMPLAMVAGARISCTVTGCCRGYPCQWGVYNPIVDEILFPVQLLETVVDYSILACILLREKKNNFAFDGKNVPIILVSYGSARFLLEFLYCNFKLFGFSSMQVDCIIMIIVGFITLRILKRSEKQQFEKEELAAQTDITV